MVLERELVVRFSDNRMVCFDSDAQDFVVSGHGRGSGLFSKWDKFWSGVGRENASCGSQKAKIKVKIVW